MENSRASPSAVITLSWGSTSPSSRPPPRTTGRAEQKASSNKGKNQFLYCKKKCESHTRFFSSGAPRSSLFPPPLPNFSTIFISAVLAQGPGKGPGAPESLNSLLLETS